jgi:hypothetical protein
MSDITLEAVAERQAALSTAHAELTAMIDKLRAQSAITLVTLPETTIKLQPGERYAGVVLDKDGAPMHHLVLLSAKPDGDIAWQSAMDWAKSVGGSLPTRQEQALLFANCKDDFEERWYWSSQQHETSSVYAWYCHFSNGYVYGNRKSFEGCARAVRRA